MPLPPSSPLNWMFIDMNSYFASVEQHVRPELRGRRVGIVPVEADGTCVIAASADAKRCGVKVGTRVREARRLCPDIVLVKARPRLYVEVHHALIRSIEQCVPIHKTYSIDEWAVRLCGNERRPAEALRLGERIRERLREQFSPWLTCSIGVAPTRLLAKIACELKKPDGLTVLQVADLPGPLEDLRPDDLPGISSGILGRLHKAGVQTVGALWSLTRAESGRIWGSVQGEAWWAGFHGHNEPEPPTRRRTMTHANVLAPEFRDDAGAHGILIRLLCKGAARLRRHGYVAQRLNVSVGSYSGREWFRDASLPSVQDTLTILRRFGELWRGRPWSAPRAGRSGWIPLAKVSMTLSGLTPLASATGSLFPEVDRLRRLSLAMDEVNRRWGGNAVYIGALHGFRHEMDDKIAFGRIPDPAGLGL